MVYDPHSSTPLPIHTDLPLENWVSLTKRFSQWNFCTFGSNKRQVIQCYATFQDVLMIVQIVILQQKMM